MNWINIAAAVTIGFISGAVAYFIAKKYPTKRILILAIPVLVFIALSALTKFLVIPPLHLWTSQREIEKSLSEISAYGYIAKYDPKAYEEIKQEILNSLKNRESQDKVIERARNIVANIVSRHIPRASDESVVRYVEAMAREIEELAEKNPEACYQFLFPDRYGPADVAKYFKPETQRADLAALAEVIRTAVEQPQPPPDSSVAETSLKKGLNQFAQVHGEDTLLLKNPFAPGIDKGKACSLIASLYKEALKLPEKESSLVLRYMLSTRRTGDQRLPYMESPPAPCDVFHDSPEQFSPKIGTLPDFPLFHKSTKDRWNK